MKFCPECGNKRGFQEYECSCGYHYQKDKQQSQKRSAFVRNDEWVRNFEEAREQKYRPRFKLAMILNAIIVTTIVILCVTYGLERVPAALFVSVFFFIFINGALIGNVRLTSSEYHALQGTSNEHKPHMCVVCGHHGIHRKTVYQTNIVECRCSKCQTHLFNE